MRPTLRPCSCVAASYVPTFPWKPRRLNQAPAPKFPKTAQNAQEILRNRCYNSLVTRFDQVLESMSRTRDEMRLYQRARRAGLKAGTWPTAPKDAPTIAQRPALPPAKDSARTAIGGFPAALAVSLPATPTRAASSGTMPGGSTPAIGGRAGPGLVDCGPGYPLPPDQFAASPYGRWQANVETMLAALAAKNDTQERRIAALEKQALDRERGTAALNALARAVGELFGVRLYRARGASRP